MKKHHVVLIVLIANALIFAIYLSGWLWFDLFPDDPFPLYLILTVSYIMPITTVGMFILLTRGFTSSQKIKWLIYVLLTGFLGSIHFYLRYKNEIQTIAAQSERKMKEGPDSLREFDP